MTTPASAPRYRATWRGALIAASDRTQVVDGYTYFPPEAIVPGRLVAVAHTSACAWKGTASYYSVTVDGQVNEDAAWVYPQPKEAASEIAGHVAFWRGVEVLPN